MSTGPHAEDDRRTLWQMPPRPPWLAQVNALGATMDMAGVVPLDEHSLLDAARRNTGLDDFGDSEWLPHFRRLIRAMEEEARLNFFGRILTRSDLLVYLEARLNITEAYKRHPEIDAQQISEPVFILGFGRSGTTILHETLSQDPQFRSVRMWEALWPWPAPEEATYETDPRIARAQARIDVVNAVSPEWANMHAQGGALPVEDIEFTYSAFFSEVWGCGFQVGSYDRWFAAQDPAYHFWWHTRIQKLLQWKYRKPHWLLKNPTHMPRIPHLLKAYPDAKIIFPHRDPVASADSVVNVEGTIFSWRTDHVYAGDEFAEWIDVDTRVRKWDDVMRWIDEGTLREGQHAHILYADFMHDPMPAIRALYRDLGLAQDASAFARMQAFLEERNRGTLGRTASYRKSASSDPRVVAEREKYRRYQSRFGVPDEI